MGILMFLWSSRYSFLIGLACLHVGFFFGEINGKSKGITEQKSTQNQAIVKEVIRHEVKEREIRSLSNSDLVRRYCRWVYDLPYDQCIKTIVPVE